jgi:hypothetical protein
MFSNPNGARPSPDAETLDPALARGTGGVLMGSSAPVQPHATD